LGHWGLDLRPGESFFAFLDRLFDSSWSDTKSTALFDLSVGSRSDPLLSWVKNSRDTTYFSIATKTTFNLFDKAVAQPTTNLVLAPVANAAGAYTNRTLFGSNSAEWRPNDGLVPVISQRGDASGFNDYDIDLFAANWRVAFTGGRNVPVRSRYNLLSVLDNTDHLQVIEAIRNQLYVNLAGLIYSLPA
jgi:hypothetical protein